MTAAGFDQCSLVTEFFENALQLAPAAIEGLHSFIDRSKFMIRLNRPQIEKHFFFQ